MSGPAWFICDIEADGRYVGNVRQEAYTGVGAARLAVLEMFFRQLQPKGCRGPFIVKVWEEKSPIGAARVGTARLFFVRLTADAELV